MVITTNNILGIVNLTKISSVPELYNTLVALKKEQYTDNERIVIRYGQHKQTLDLTKEILAHIDIPDYFVVYEFIDVNTGLDFNFKDSHCVYPWVAQHVTTTGDIKPCCDFESANDINCNISAADLKTVYLGNAMTDLRKQFLRGDRPVGCVKCWQKESAGVQSMRQFSRSKFKDFYYTVDYQEDNFNNVKAFDLRVGNKCNLTCNICDAFSSSAIADKQLKLGNLSSLEFNSIRKLVKWAESEEFWNQLEAISNNIKYLNIFGGEPLMSKTHFSLLKKLVELNVSNNIIIDYNSNGTVFSEKFFDVWQHFKEVKIYFSIDDIEDRFEAQRSGAKWQQVCDNLEKFKQRVSTNFIIEIVPTINTQNVYWLPELITWIYSQGFKSISFNMVSSPWNYNIRSLPIEEKNKIIKKLQSDYIHSVIPSIVNVLQE